MQLTNLGNNVAYYWKALASDSLLNSSNSSIFNFTVIRDNDPVINKWTWDNTITTSKTNTYYVIVSLSTSVEALHIKFAFPPEDVTLEPL